MKRIFTLIWFCIVGIISINAQKFALIDMEYILENIPAYQQATNQLSQLSQRYQKEIDTKSKEAENLYKAYQKNATSMSASQKVQQEEAIISKEKEMIDLRQKYFGPKGEMNKQQETLISPIQDKIYEAVKQISTQKGYDAVIDRASASYIIFASPRIDISDEVLTIYFK